MAKFRPLRRWGARLVWAVWNMQKRRKKRQAGTGFTAWNDNDAWNDSDPWND